MIGSYKFTEHNPLGKTPAILIVMSVDDGKSAETIVSAVGERGPYWRITTATVSGDKLEWVPRAASGKRVISWRDANSGSVDLHPPPDRNVMITTSSMTRLDG